MDGFPNDFKIYFEVPVRNGVAHLVSRCKWQFGVHSHEFRKVLFNVVAGFANNFKISYNGVLDKLVAKKSHLVHIRNVFLNSLYSLKNVR